MQEGHGKRIVDRLDLQILLAVIVIFVSSWAYLNEQICDFTTATPYNIQLTYIFVQYVVSLYLLLCLYLSSIKGRYIFEVDRDLGPLAHKWVNVFMQSWFVVTLICVVAVACAAVLPLSWLICAYLTVVSFSIYLRKNGFGLRQIVLAVGGVVLCFPLYISIMTMAMAHVEILLDKDYYNLSDKVLITTQVRGYACNYDICGLQQGSLYQNSTYDKKKNMILLDAYAVRDNYVSVGIIGPIRTVADFFVYPCDKIMDRPFVAKDAESAMARYKRVNVNVKP